MTLRVPLHFRGALFRCAQRCCTKESAATNIASFVDSTSSPSKRSEWPRLPASSVGARPLGPSPTTTIPVVNMAKRKTEPAGLEYGPGIYGKHLFRVSEQYVADHVARLVKRGRADAAKLDLVLRGIALSPDHAGDRRDPGLVLSKQFQIDYAALHDLVRDPRRFAETAPEDDDADRLERDKKREWVREQLVLLSGTGQTSDMPASPHRLLRRDAVGDGRQQITMLRDLGDGGTFDDPGAEENRRSYITIPGSVLADPRFRQWGAPELVGFYCALIAERFARAASKRNGTEVDQESVAWVRQADWFNNENGYRPDGHIIPPFSTSTIQKGLKALIDSGFIDAHWSMRSPDTGERFKNRRKVYTNRFASPVTRDSNVIELLARRSA